MELDMSGFCESQGWARAWEVAVGQQNRVTILPIHLPVSESAHIPLPKPSFLIYKRGALLKSTQALELTQIREHPFIPHF